MDRRGNGTARIGRVALAGAAAAWVFLAGACNDEDKLADVVERAGQRLVASSGSGVASAPAEIREKTYNSIIGTLQSALRGHEDDPGAGAARLLIAQATLGQADLASEEVGEGHRDLLHQITEARSRLDLQTKRSDFAASLRVYDPTEDLGQLDESRGEIEQELASARAELADHQQRMARLQAQMDEQREQASARIAEATELRSEASGTDAIRRAELIKEVNGIEREAARHERRYAELEILRGSLEDEAKMVRIRIASFQGREELVQAARQRVEDSAALLESESQAARTEAQNLGSELGGVFDGLMEIVEQRVDPAFEEAVTKYRSTVSQAQQAKRSEGGSASAVIGVAQHASANLHRANAEVLGSLADLGERLGRKLDASRFTEAAGKLRERRDTLIGEAADLYESAASSMGSVRVAGVDSSGLSDTLRAFASKLRGEDGEGGEAEGAPEAPAPEPEGEGASPDSDEVQPATDVGSGVEDPGDE